VSAAVRAVLIAAWLLAVGLAAVWLEVENVRSGARTRDLLRERDVRMEKLRRLELRYNGLVSPDVLERRLPPEMDEPLLRPGFFHPQAARGGGDP
jgi:hypothetical protein